MVNHWTQSTCWTVRTLVSGRRCVPFPRQHTPSNRRPTSIPRETERRPSGTSSVAAGAVESARNVRSMPSLSPTSSNDAAHGRSFLIPHSLIPVPWRCGATCWPWEGETSTQRKRRFTCISLGLASGWTWPVLSTLDTASLVYLCPTKSSLLSEARMKAETTQQKWTSTTWPLVDVYNYFKKLFFDATYVWPILLKACLYILCNCVCVCVIVCLCDCVFVHVCVCIVH